MNVLSINENHLLWSLLYALSTNTYVRMDVFGDIVENWHSLSISMQSQILIEVEVYRKNTPVSDSSVDVFYETIQYLRNDQQ